MVMMQQNNQKDHCESLYANKLTVMLHNMLSIYFFIGKLHNGSWTHDSITSPFIPLLRKEELPSKPGLIGITIYF